MPDALYDIDFVLWSERQADALRRLRLGERPNDLDWENLIEEVEDLGKSQVNAVESLLTRALEHLLKAAAWPAARDAGHWRHEATTFLLDARRRWAPSMGNKIELDDLFADALAAVQTLDQDGLPPGPLPQASPFSLDELLPPNRRETIDPVALLAKLRG